MRWYCVTPIFICSVLIAWRTKWSPVLIAIMPSLALGTLSGIMAWYATLQERGAVYCDTAPCFAALMFFSVFGYWFLVIISIVSLARFIQKIVGCSPNKISD